MSDPILELLAAPPNPAMSVNEDVVRAGGLRRLRRRTLRRTVVGVTVFIGAAAVAFSALGAGTAHDTLPAFPTPTATPTPDVTPTETSSASPTATVTSSPTATTVPSATPSTTATGTPAPTATQSTGSSTPTTSPSTTPTAGVGWSESVALAGRSFRAQLVPADHDNFDVVVQADGEQVALRHAIYQTEGSIHLDPSDRRFVYFIGGHPIIDLVSIEGTPVTDEEITSIRLEGVGDYPTGEPRMDIHVTVVRTSTANPGFDSGRPPGWVVKVADGSTWDLDEF